MIIDFKGLPYLIREIISFLYAEAELLPIKDYQINGGGMNNKSIFLKFHDRTDARNLRQVIRDIYPLVYLNRGTPVLEIKMFNSRMLKFIEDRSQDQHDDSIDIINGKIKNLKIKP